MTKNEEKELLSKIAEYEEVFPAGENTDMQFIFDGSSYSDSHHYVDFEEFKKTIPNPKYGKK